MGKRIIIMLIIVLVMLPISRFIIHTVSCNNTYKITETTLREPSVYFNSGLKIKYNYLSNRLKKYISEDDFYGLYTWYDVYNKFDGIQKSNTSINSINRYSFKYIISFVENSEQKSVYYRITFIDTLFGIKIDYIDVKISEIHSEE